MKINKVYSNRKTLALQVKDGQVIVRIPYGMSQDIVERFISSKQSWLNKKLMEYEAPGYHKGKSILIFGKRYETQEHIGPRFSINFYESTLIITRPKDKSDKTVSKSFDNALKLELDHIIQHSLRCYADKLGISIPQHSIRVYKRLHGRCSSKGDLGFNTYLYHKPKEFIDCVVAHEIAHLIHFNHSKSFYNLLYTLRPDYKQIVANHK